MKDSFEFLLVFNALKPLFCVEDVGFILDADDWNSERMGISERPKDGSFGDMFECKESSAVYVTLLDLCFE